MPKFDFKNGMMMPRPERPVAPLVDWIVLKTGADRTKIDNIIRANRHNRLVMMALSGDYLSRCMLLKQIGTQYELPGGFDKANTPGEIEEAAKQCKEAHECIAKCARPLIKPEPADGKQLTESQQKQMKSFIESECRRLGCQELSSALSTGYDICCESIGDTVRGLSDKTKKPDDEELQDEFFIRPYGGPVHQPNRYPGLIWSILEEINCDHNGKITKEQALEYIKRLMPAIKDNPTDEVFEKTLYRVVNAIELPGGGV